MIYFEISIETKFTNSSVPTTDVKIRTSVNKLCIPTSVKANNFDSPNFTRIRPIRNEFGLEIDFPLLNFGFYLWICLPTIFII